MKIGIRLHDLCKGNIDEVISKIKENNFENIQLVFKKSLIDSNGNQLIFNKENAEYIGNKLKQNNINVSMLGAYFNPVHSNKKLVEENTKYFEEHLKYCSLLNTSYVGTETGSYNDDKWTYNPRNQTEEGYQDTMNTFRYLKNVAEKYNSTILMEPAYGHVIYSVKQLKRAIDELNSSNVKVTIDIFNLLYEGNYKNYKEIFIEALDTFKKDIKIIHLKDFIFSSGKLIQCGLGDGIIDFKFIIMNVKKYCPEATLIFEGVTGSDIQKSRLLIDSLL